VDLDFKEDQLAIEAYVRMRCGWRDESEISEEEYLIYANEYIEENPFIFGLVVNGREGIVYDRYSGEFLAMRTFPGFPYLWERGAFWYTLPAIVFRSRERQRENPSKVRLLAEYFGLVDPAYDD
jgi:hypothetical protein